MFIRNAWYAAAWDRDLTDGLLALTILGDAIVLYRQTDGQVVALEDACVHRRLPLSMGRIKGDLVECGYHGMKYDATGACVHIPCSDRIPRNARVRSYPVEPRYGLIWIWMGAPGLANRDDIMIVDHWGDSRWAATAGDSMTVDCNYLYVTDNLLDPSHVAWVHPSSFGDASCETEPVNITANEHGLCASRWMTASAVAPLYQRFVRFDGLCDRLQHYEVRFPSHALIKAVFVPAGGKSPAAETDRSAFVMDSYNFLTPIDATHTRYFWLQVHNAPDQDGAATAVLAEGVKGAFEEDRLILNAVQKSFERSPGGNIDISIDSAPLRFRRLTRKLLDAERAHRARPAEALPG